jgi:hypothetical protein
MRTIYNVVWCLASLWVVFGVDEISHDGIGAAVEPDSL